MDGYGPVQKLVQSIQNLFKSHLINAFKVCDLSALFLKDILMLALSSLREVHVKKDVFPKCLKIDGNVMKDKSDTYRGVVEYEEEGESKQMILNFLPNEFKHFEFAVEGNGMENWSEYFQQVSESIKAEIPTACLQDSQKGYKAAVVKIQKRTQRSAQY